MNNVVFGKTMENVRRRRNYLVSKPKTSYHKVFYRNFVNNRNKKNVNIYGQTCVFRIFNTRTK